MSEPPQSGPPGPPQSGRSGPSGATGRPVSPQDEAPRRALQDAVARERELRARLSEVIVERRRLTQEADRLEGQVVLPGAAPRLSDVARRYRARSEELGRELDELRARLREQEALIAERRAEADGV